MKVTLQDLKAGNSIRLSRKHLLKKTGELFALKHSINLSSDLLDLPDFYWEREELENMYLKTCRYFNIPKRTQVLMVFDFLFDSSKMLIGHF